MMLRVLVLSMLLAACAQAPGIANPATEFCIEHGGLPELRETDAGSIGYCILDGRECEEWAYYRGECPAPCGDCPLLAMPAPGWCADGVILPGQMNECGCRGPPICERGACTKDAKVCPDGSVVSRIPPACEFSPCPGE